MTVVRTAVRRRGPTTRSSSGHTISEAAFAPAAQAHVEPGLPAYQYAGRAIGADERGALEAALQLRNTVFAHELRWVPPGQDGHERDRCDAVAQHFAAFACHTQRKDVEPELVGYARVLIPDHPLMLEREFAAILGGSPVEYDPRRAFEVSRFVVHSRHRGRVDAGRHGVADHLARAIVRWAHLQRRSEWLSVCEVRHVRALRMRGLPFAEIGRVVEYQRGVPVCAAQLDLAQAAARLRTHRPRDYAWYMEGD